MTLEEEVNEIVQNALTAYRLGEITAEQFQDATRIPLKDLFISDNTQKMYVFMKG
jgi:hypothetical protein